jgi:hypothetical protein
VSAIAQSPSLAPLRCRPDGSRTQQRQTDVAPGRLRARIRGFPLPNAAVVSVRGRSGPAARSPAGEGMKNSALAGRVARVYSEPARSVRSVGPSEDAPSLLRNLAVRSLRGPYPHRCGSSTGHLHLPDRYSALSPQRARHLDGRTIMLWRAQTLSFAAFAILASAVLVTASTAQQDAADRQRMVEEIDAMLASAAGSNGVARLSPRVRAAMIEVPRHEFVPLEYRSSAYTNRRSR